MKQKIVFFFGLLALAAVFNSCCKSGLGGNATVICHVIDANTGKNLNNTIVYIYYGSSKPPASISKFDDSKNTGLNNNTVTFTGLKCGTYYLYAAGYDSTVSLPLKGGGPFSLLHSNRNKTVNTTISVSY
jgi:hypothetical protein